MLKKYGRSFHLPWSPGTTSDDKRHTRLELEEMFVGKTVVITEKLDGENTTIYADGKCHARSTDSVAHPSRTRMASLAARIKSFGMPEGWRIVGENVYAKHSIYYNQLPDFFLVFGIVNEKNISLPWSEVVEWCELLELHTVPVVDSFTFDYPHLDSSSWSHLYPRNSAFSTHNNAEGYVVRLEDGYSMNDLSSSLSKFVRQGHVQTDEHWMHAALTFNSIAETPSSKCVMCGKEVETGRHCFEHPVCYACVPR